MPKLTPSQYKRAVSMLGIHHKNLSGYREQDMLPCPFHSDTTPSLSINFNKGVYHCFQCGKKGSLGSLVWEQKHESISKFLGLEKDITDIIRYTPFEETPPLVDKPPMPVVNPPIDIRGPIIPCSESKEALQYLKKRYISLDTAIGMGMGYSDMVTINGTEFSKRLLMPIYDEHQVLVNMEGRDVTFQQKPKCLYPKGAIKPLYQSQQLDTKKPLFVFEGAIKMAVARSDPYFANSTTTFGANISDYQLALLSMFPHIIIVPDNDDAGKLLPVVLRTQTKSLVEVLRISDQTIKDADEIPVKSGLTIQQFREAGGFEFETNYDLGEYY
jgi:DNA primase